MLKRAHSRKKSLVPVEPSPLALAGVFLAAASLCAAFGTSVVEGGLGEAARALFFVLLVVGMASLLRCAAEETK
jgi:hypothetical protein